jgi:hypothetical protein
MLHSQVSFAGRQTRFQSQIEGVFLTITRQFVEPGVSLLLGSAKKNSDISLPDLGEGLDLDFGQ